MNSFDKIFERSYKDPFLLFVPCSLWFDCSKIPDMEETFNTPIDRRSERFKTWPMSFGALRQTLIIICFIKYEWKCHVKKKKPRRTHICLHVAERIGKNCLCQHLSGMSGMLLTPHCPIHCTSTFISLTDANTEQGLNRTGGLLCQESTDTPAHAFILVSVLKDWIEHQMLHWKGGLFCLKSVKWSDFSSSTSGIVSWENGTTF